MTTTEPRKRMRSRLLTLMEALGRRTLVRQWLPEKSEKKSGKWTRMVRRVALLALCVVPFISAAHFSSDPFLLQGSVYCDTCRCGYETKASTYLAGAVVRIECRKRENSELTYTKEGVTDSAGKYKILVESDRANDYCDAVLVKSPDPECSIPDAGRDRARVILTRNNGINSNARFANALGFLKRTPLASCNQILKLYQKTEE